jgi:hypothetical protein
MKGLVILGLLVFVVSWFLPVHEGLDAMDALQREMSKIGGGKVESGLPGGPSGWQAFRVNWDNLWKAKTWSEAGDDPKGLVWNLTSVTNLAMLLAAFVLFSGTAKAARGVGWVLVVAFVLNASWLYLDSTVGPDEGAGMPGLGGSLREGLRIGYYAWLASFGLVALGFLLHKE